VKSGSADLAIPGFRLTVLDDELHPVPPNTLGVPAIHRENSPLSFWGLLERRDPQASKAIGSYGDTMLQNAEGYLFFVDRNDDIHIR
jgi:acetyl-CoA synthetase